MSKTPTKTKKKLSENKFPWLYVFSSIGFVFFIYFFSLFREWQTFDERVFYNETLFPIPTNFSEVFEVIKTFVYNYHIESMNTFFSNFMTIRSNQLASIVIVFVSYLFKKSAFLYHLLQIIIHLSNTFLVWLIFNKTSELILKKGNEDKLKLILVSLITCIWAVHSANTEATLLVTNWDTILTYSFCLGFIYYEVSSLSDLKKKTKPIIIAILFCTLMFFTEYSYTLPLIVFFIVLAFSYKLKGNLKEAAKHSFYRSKPYFWGLVLYILFSLANPDSSITNLFTSHHFQSPALKNISPIYIFLERNLWLVPQIFVQFIKLLFFPKTLSTYQSNLINLSETLFDTNSMLCFLAYATFLILPIILFFISKKNDMKYLSFFIYAFFFSLFPFLHILLPTYCLSADRYCYFPLIFLLLILLNILLLILNNSKSVNSKILISVLSCLLLVLSVRTLIRIQEWHDSYSLYKSALKIEKNPLYKGQKLIVFADYVGAQGKQKEMEDSLQESLKVLKKARKELKQAKKKNSNQPITLKIYGLDYKSLILKSAYATATIRLDNYQEEAKSVLSFFEPYIKGRVYLGGINQITFYANLLLKSGQAENTVNVLNYGLKMYPYSSSIISSLAEIYMSVKKDPDEAYKYLKVAYKYFTNDSVILYKLLRYYEVKNDLENQAKFAYLLGLRNHSAESYQRAVQIYLDLNKLAEAHKSLRKLAAIKSNDPITLLLTSRYLDLIGKREQIEGILKTAYALSKSQGSSENINVTKSILLSLINIYVHLGNHDDAKKYINEFENIKNLSEEDKIQLNRVKSALVN